MVTITYTTRYETTHCTAGTMDDDGSKQTTDSSTFDSTVHFSQNAVLQASPFISTLHWPAIRQQILWYFDMMIARGIYVHTHSFSSVCLVLYWYKMHFRFQFGRCDLDVVVFSSSHTWLNCLLIIQRMRWEFGHWNCTLFLLLSSLVETLVVQQTA